jgi:hypothetical protein
MRSGQWQPVERRLQVDRHGVAEGLRRMAGTLGMGYQLAHVGARCVTDDRQLDRYFVEISRGVIDVVFLGISEAGANVGRRILDRDLIKWREPRQLGEQSKRRPHHQVLER